jgi:PKHD-type hydroxylase
MTRVMEAIRLANASYWRYQLYGFVPADYPSILMYEAGVLDHFSSHSDSSRHNPTRKLSFSVELTDPRDIRGGELIFKSQRPMQRVRGAITIFPSTAVHEVTPLVMGRRLALVGWVHGTTLR